MRKGWIGCLGLAWTVLGAGAASADQTVCTQMISSVPFTVGSSGVYCLSQAVNLPCGDLTSKAITVTTRAGLKGT